MASPSKQPVAIVTGAGTGIGREIALGLGEAGYRLVIVGRTERTLAATARDLAPTGVESMTVVADVAEPTAATEIVHRARQQWGRIDVLVNNAALAPLRSIEETDADEFQRVLLVNVVGPALLIACCWPSFVEGKGGCVVNISSQATVDPFPGFFAYAASKAAVESLVRSVVVEGEAFGARAFAVAPGAVETAMLRSIVDATQLPSALTLDPRDVATVVVDCVLGRRDEHSGTTIRLPSPAPA